MKTFILLITSCMLWACNPVSTTENVVENDSAVIEPKKTVEEKINRTDTLEFITQSAYLLIDRKGEKYIGQPYIKFEPFVGFDNYKTEAIYKGAKASINYKSHTLAREYRTMITNAYKASNDVDFGGYYKLAVWGCGSSCQGTALVDMRDGRVYEGPVSANRFEIMPDSRLYIVNPPDSTGYYEDCPYCKPRLFVWDENAKKFEELLPGGKLVPMVNYH